MLPPFTIGLAIGAFFVRSFTLMLVDKGTLAEYRYLEHGAFYDFARTGRSLTAGGVSNV